MQDQNAANGDFCMSAHACLNACVRACVCVCLRARACV